jgi:dUTPase
MKLRVKIKKLSPEAIIPQYQTTGAAGFDFHAIEDMTLDQSFELTQVMLPVMAMSQDAKEGFAAFNEKRSPNWTGK